MEDVNYNDTVIVPFLEKKCKDLLSHNLVLEAKLLVEQTKVKNYENFVNSENEKIAGFLSQIENLKVQIINSNQLVNNIQIEKNTIEQERNNLLNHLTMMQSQVIREQSLKDNAVSEYQNLNAKYNEVQQKMTDLENINKNLVSEFEEYKKKINEPRSRKQQSSVV